MVVPTSNNFRKCSEKGRNLPFWICLILYRPSLSSPYIFRVISLTNRVWGLGAFLRWWPPSTMWVGPLINLMATTWDVWIITSFLNLGFCAACWAHLPCHHESWSTSVSHPFSSLNGALGFVGGKHYPIFWLALRNFAIPVCFPYILLYRYLFSLVTSVWFVIAVCGSISVSEIVKCLGSL